MAGTSVAERLQILKVRIDQACVKACRAPDSVRLLAVSKLQSGQKIRAALNAGQSDFAENYIQEALLKQTELVDLPLHWHFIGRIQSNKVKRLVGKFSVIHSVDRLSIAEALNRLSVKQNLVQDIFLQFNVANESSKGGMTEPELEDLLTAIENCANLRVLGLMVMPPLTADPELVRRHFVQARTVLAKLRAKFGSRHPLTQLSMGTSADFEVAISEGSTWIRIGTDVFGPREEIV